MSTPHEAAFPSKKVQVLGMKWLVAVFLMACAGASWSAGQAAATPALKGEILEIVDVPSYTYLRLKTADGEKWAAVDTAKLSKGATVTIEHPERMDNFKSTALKRTFPVIYFGSLPSMAAPPASTAAQLTTAHSGVASTPFKGDVNVAKATGPDARTVAEIAGKSTELDNRTVVLRARVVKFTPAIMGKNWLHLRDGSGSAADGTNDVLATTQGQAKVGDIVLVKGIVRKDKNFGSGYAYKVLVEDALLQK